jgi:hypothetical protein
MDRHLYPPYDEVNGGSFEHRKNFRTRCELKILDRLPRNERHELKTDINYNSRQHTDGNNREYRSPQVVSRTALLRTTLFKRDILAPNAHVKLRIVGAGIRCCQSCGSDLERGNAAGTS